MSINSEQVANTAKLAKLKINADEASEVAERITAILDLVDQMQAVNTEHVEPMANALDAVQRLRIDQANPSEDPQARRAVFQTIAPATDQGLYLVPKVID
jgi:aspartyl-tRNA(Asn)/glutamyl-tRNA(Gln) amidotransferase subunit C